MLDKPITLRAVASILISLGLVMLGIAFTFAVFSEDAVSANIVGGIGVSFFVVGLTFLFTT